MGWKAVPRIAGLTREPNPKGKSRQNGERTLKEAGEERWSASVTLDRARSGQNIYEGYSSGAECWQAMCDEADEYRIKGKTKNGKDFERKLGHNAVIGFAVIFNPPSDVAVNWTPEEYDAWISDSWEVLEELEPRVFRWENLRMTADHKDEGCYNGKDPHRHAFGVPKDADGHYSGKLIDSLLKRRICENYPRMMRERGWSDMEDLDLTDWDKFKTDEDYKQERVDYWKGYGNRVNKYIEEQHARKQEVFEATVDEFNKSVDQLNAEQADLARDKADIARDRAEVADREARVAELQAQLAKDKANMQREIDKRAEDKANTKSAEFEAQKLKIRLEGKPSIGSKLKGLISSEKQAKFSLIRRNLKEAPDRVAQAMNIVDYEADVDERNKDDV